MHKFRLHINIFIMCTVRTILEKNRYNDYNLFLDFLLLFLKPGGKLGKVCVPQGGK